MLHGMVAGYWCFRTAYQSYLQGPSSPRRTTQGPWRWDQ